MFRDIKVILFKLFLVLRGYKLLQIFSGRKPIILVYHRFDGKETKGRLNVEVFEKQVLELQERFNIISLSEAVRVIRSNQPVLKNSIVITVDDGYYDFYCYAYPILKKNNIPATIYVTSDFVDRKVWLWPDRVSYALSNTTYKEYIFQTEDKEVVYFLDNERYYGKLWKEIIRHCLSLEEDKKNEFIIKFENDLGVEPPMIPTDEFSAVSWSELKEMAQNGIEIGAHTSTHPSLPNVSEKKLAYEISGCKKTLEDNLNIKVANFCYPNGTEKDYNLIVMDEVEKAGFDSATVAFSDSVPFKNIYELRRYGVDGNMMQFHKVIYGVEFLKNKLRDYVY